MIESIQKTKIHGEMEAALGRRNEFYFILFVQILGVEMESI